MINTHNEGAKRTITDRLRTWCKTNLYICNMISLFLVVLIGVYGWAYLFIYLPLFAGFLIWVFWEQYLFGLDMVEIRLWGKPLNVYKERGERPPKLKFVWNKKKYLEEQKNGNN